MPVPLSLGDGAGVPVSGSLTAGRPLGPTFRGHLQGARPVRDPLRVPWRRERGHPLERAVRRGAQALKFVGSGAECRSQPCSLRVVSFRTSDL